MVWTWQEQLFMNQLISRHRAELAHLCQLHHVHRLELFGSAARTQDGGQVRDVDFLVQFEDLDKHDYVSAYFGLLESLEKLLNKPVDLVMLSAVKNPYLAESIEKNRVLLYAA
jgi:uncharacterized protein